MDRLSLNADERTILGKNVKRLRRDGILPGHVFGKKTETEHVSVNTKIFLKTFKEAGATGVIDLKIGAEKVRPVMVRGVQFDPVSGNPIHIDFYQVDLTQKVTVPVPMTLIGDEPESVHLGESIVLQTLAEVQMEALPNDLIDNIEVDISTLVNIDDAISVADLKIDREKLTILTPEEEVVVKLAPAVSAEMEELLEEQAAETEAAAEEQAAEEGTEKPEGVEGEVVEGAASAEGSGEPKEEGTEKPAEGEEEVKHE